MKTSSASEARCRSRAEIIKALSHPSRILMAEALSEGELCVCELTRLVGDDISTISKHLSVMKAAGLVNMEKRGQNVYYSLCCPCLGDFFRCIDQLAHNRACAYQSALT